MFYGLSITRTQRGQQLDKLLILLLYLAQCDELFDDLGCDLVLEEFLVVTEELLYSRLRVNVIFLVRFHSLREEEVDPLCRIHLIYFIASNGTLQELICVLA